MIRGKRKLPFRWGSWFRTPLSGAASVPISPSEVCRLVYSARALIRKCRPLWRIVYGICQQKQPGGVYHNPMLMAAQVSGSAARAVGLRPANHVKAELHVKTLLRKISVPCAQCFARPDRLTSPLALQRHSLRISRSSKL